uniref:AAA domain-containing protein n=1 Tax=Prevotella sp. GTC17254 TaxID=3236794 RepID=A0AB33IVV5_9BACT
MYVFYDEVQYLKDREVRLKSLVDIYRNVKFVASGSVAVELRKEVMKTARDVLLIIPVACYAYIVGKNMMNHTKASYGL